VVQFTGIGYSVTAMPVSIPLASRWRRGARRRIPSRGGLGRGMAALAWARFRYMLKRAVRRIVDQAAPGATNSQGSERWIRWSHSG
jgi:hypothetical protein